MQKKPDIRSFWLRKLFKVHALALFILLGVYFVFAFLDPGLLSYDLRQKFRALADDTITVSAIVLGPPAQPVVTATADCDESSGTLSVALDWGDDPNTYTYDIVRDSAPLVSGLGTSLYNDTNVVLATTYQYEVTGNGPMGPGSATSVSVSVTTPSVCEITAPAPAVTIVSFAGRNVDSYNGTPRVENRRPIFSGTTSMANATILVSIGVSFLAEFSANANGYWEWQPPYGVPSGSHMFTVTATDPDDGTRQATASLRFDILKRNDTGQSGKMEETGTSPTVPSVPSSGVPLDFTLSVDDTVLQGGALHMKIVIDALQPKYSHITVPIRYSIINENGGSVTTETRKAYITEGATFSESFSIPMYTASGKYFLQAEILLDTMNVSRKAAFTVTELPLIALSSGGTISYADIIRNLGWVVFFSLFFFFFFGFLCFFENLPCICRAMGK